MQSLLDPIGPVAAGTAQLSWILFIGGTVVLLIVMGLTLFAVTARRDRAARLSGTWFIVAGGVAFPVLVLSALLLYSLRSAAELSPRDDGDALHIEVVGEQWWWRVHYLGPDGAHDFTLANEIRLPAGKTVVLHLKSADVIHSFWVPALGGKLDMIPGRTNRLRLKADRPGRMRGQCAEYCGGPHALMAIRVVAETHDDYLRWARNQRLSARVGSSPSESSPGQNLFLEHCASCHAVRGTAAAGTLGPDLTHVASRLSLGAGLLPMNAGALAAWIVSAQHLKPESLMPEFRNFSGEDLRAVTQYLESLD